MLLKLKLLLMLRLLDPLPEQLPHLATCCLDVVTCCLVDVPEQVTHVAL